jgi:hypothetical protein
MLINVVGDFLFVFLFNNPQIINCGSVFSDYLLFLTWMENSSLNIYTYKITQYLINGIRFLSQICPRYSFPCARNRHKVSNSFTNESGRDK